MGLLSNQVSREELKPGDHIYSWRAAYVYAHHGIYVGDGMVIHFTQAAGQEIGTGTVLDRIIFSSSPSTMGTQCERCGDQSKLAGVISSCIDCFLSGGNLYLFQYSVSPAFFIAKARGGTCTLAAPDSPDDVLYRANYLLNNGFGTYNIFKNNCEDFAIYCKTGLLVNTTFSVGRSGQLTSLAAAFSAIMSSPLRFLTTSASGLSVVTSAMYCLGRYISDIGVRRDVVKLPVESLVVRSDIDELDAAAEMVGQNSNRPPTTVNAVQRQSTVQQPDRVQGMGTGLRCFKCGESGHRMNDCKKGDRYGKCHFVEYEEIVEDEVGEFDGDPIYDEEDATEEYVEGDQGHGESGHLMNDCKKGDRYDKGFFVESEEIVEDEVGEFDGDPVYDEEDAAEEYVEGVRRVGSALVGTSLI